MRKIRIRKPDMIFVVNSCRRNAQTLIERGIITCAFLSQIHVCPIFESDTGDRTGGISSASGEKTLQRLACTSV